MANNRDFKSELNKINEDINQLDRAIEKLSAKRQKLISRKSTINQLIQEQAAEILASQDWERNDHPWSNKVLSVLKSAFKLDKFRPHQLSTINAVLSKHDCILLMPTGGGKSLCYQLPAMVLDGITVVVSPLVSLMEDQIMAMEALNVPAALLNASSTREHVNYVQQQMTEKSPAIKLLYVTPEKLAKSKRFMAKMEKMHKAGRFSLLAIDEVHCCSQWGHDFRPDYKFLGIMRRQFPGVPILGLTATATASVIADVQNILNIQGCLVLKASFNRPNLKYEVVCKSSSQKDNVAELESLLKNRFNGLSGIIYCFSIKDSEEISKELRQRGIRARAYHAQLDAKSRSSVHKQWSTNSLQVVVATVAFGMGIDKPDVRFVIHHSMPKSMENFYQESGRAGRDDHEASCILFYRFQDIFRQSTMVFTEQKGLEHVYAMVAYCLDLSSCRRCLIAQHFGERWNASDCNNMCDHCDKYSPYVEMSRNVTEEYRAICRILEHADRLDERLTSQKLIEAWGGKGPPKLRPPGHQATRLTRENCERIVALLFLESYLMEEFHFTPYSTISYINTGTRRLPSGDELHLPMPSLRNKQSDNKRSHSPVASDSATKTLTATSFTNKPLPSRTVASSSNSDQSTSNSKCTVVGTSGSKPRDGKTLKKLKASSSKDGNLASIPSSTASSSKGGCSTSNSLGKTSKFKKFKTESSIKKLKASGSNSISVTQSNSTSSRLPNTSSKPDAEEIVLSDDDISLVSEKQVFLSDNDICSITKKRHESLSSELEFDDYDVLKGKNRKRIVLTVSDSD